MTMGAMGAVEALIASFFSGSALIGVILGSGGAFANLFSLWYDINRSVERRRPMRGYAGRYVFSGVLMLLGGLISLEALFGVFVGLMNLKLAAYLVGWRERG